MTTRQSEGRRVFRTTRPEKQGLYDPAYEHDACGVGFVVDAKGRKSHKIVQQGLAVDAEFIPRMKSSARWP